MIYTDKEGGTEAWRLEYGENGQQRWREVGENLEAEMGERFQQIFSALYFSEV
jgi:hypothetical protein